MATVRRRRNDATPISATPMPTARAPSCSPLPESLPVTGIALPPDACTERASEATAEHVPEEVAVTLNVPAVVGAVMVRLALPAALAVAWPRVLPPPVKTTTALAQKPFAVRVTEEPAVGLLLLVVTVGVPTG